MYDNRHRTVSLADRIFDKLEDDILFGRYAKGEILTELRLVEELGVSRTPIREALSRLAQERLIADTGKGSVVLGITAEDLQDILNIRLAVEGLATYYATLNMKEGDLAELRHILELQEYYAGKNDPSHIKEMDDQFHNLICTISGRQVIADTLRPLHKKIQNYRRASMASPARAKAATQEHRAIFNAMAAGDAELAKKLTIEHVQNAKNSILGKEEK